MTPAFPGAALAAACDAARAHLRIDGGGEDAALTHYAASAMALCEQFTGAALIAREWSAALPATARWQRLAMAPVLAITRVTDAGGAALDPLAYAIDIDARGDGWVRVARGNGVARVTYDAGLAADWEALPPPVAQGVVLLVAHLFDARDGARAVPAAVAALWRPYRRMRLTLERCA